MRKSLFTAVAAAPLAALAMGASALAQTTISDAQTTPIATSTAGDTTISTTGSVSPSTGTAVTIDSNNSVNNAGVISIKDANNAIGILAQGGHTGGIINTGSISVIESYTPKDINNDGVVDGVYAEGTGRYGIRITGGGGFNGSLTAGSGGVITVDGNNSYGISIESLLQGNLIQGNTISVTGDNSMGLSIPGGVTGKVQVTGNTGGLGGGTGAIDIGGGIGGSLGIYSTVQASGYRLTTRSSVPSVNAGLDPSDLLQGAPAVNIRASIGGGVLLGAPPPGTVSTDTTTDADGDGIIDSIEGTSSIISYGGAPAVQIGSAGQDVKLGAFGTGSNAYGLIIEGSVAGSGVFDNIPGTGIQVGLGTGTVEVAGGIKNLGVISGSASEANSVALHIMSGVTAPVIYNGGTITAGVTSAAASNTTALLIESGATVNSLTNTSSITAQLTGALGSAAAVVDKSGGINSVSNLGTIAAALVAPVLGGSAGGTTTALDLSANTSGITLSQTTIPNAIAPVIIGDVLLGSGNDTVSLLAGSVSGALSYGTGSGSLLIDNAATYRGALTASGPISVNINNGSLTDLSTSAIAAPTLAIGGSGQLTVTADPLNNVATRFDVSGAATIAAGGKLGLNLISLPAATQTFTVIQAGTLTSAVTDANLAGTSPYLLSSSFHVDQAAGQVSVTVSRRTAAELGLNPVETAAYDGVYNGLGQDAGIQRAVLAQTTLGGLQGVYDQLLPDHAGGVFRALTWAAEQQADAAADAPLGQQGAGPTRAWTQEIGQREHHDGDGTTGYSLLGFGLVGGLESVSSHGDALGVRLGFVSTNVSNPDLASANLIGVSEVNAGVYWRGTYGGVTLDAQADAGFVWAKSDREFLYTDTLGTVNRKAESSWGGYVLSSRFGAAYNAHMGKVFFQPRIHADYVRLHEGGYDESGGGSGFDLSVDSRASDALSVTGSVVAGLTFGQTFHWRPQIEVGYRSVISGDAGDTTAAFVGGSPFTLAADSVSGGAFIGHIGLRAYSNYLDLLLEAGGEIGDDYTDLDVRMTARTVF